MPGLNKKGILNKNKTTSEKKIKIQKNMFLILSD
jgi:hypothetical protein